MTGVQTCALPICSPERLQLEAATVLPQAKELPPFNLKHFELQSSELNDFSVADLKGKWSLFFFGYTHCPDVCPTELFMLSEMMRSLEQDSALKIDKPQVVFVSVDPQRDTPKSLQEYTGYYHPSFLGVTGEQNVVDSLSHSMGAMYERVYYLNGRELVVDEDEDIPEGLENSYLINHSAAIFLTNPDGDLHAILTTPHNPDVMIRDLLSIQNAW